MTLCCEFSVPEPSMMCVSVSFSLSYMSIVPIALVVGMKDCLQTNYGML